MIKPNSPDVKKLSPISVAFLGDAVYEVLVRRHLIAECDMHPEDMHKNAVKYVSAKNQAADMDCLISHLTDEELMYFKRGKNAGVSHVPKGATPMEYHTATGLETLFGYLYLEGQIDRIEYLFSLICQSRNGDV